MLKSERDPDIIKNIIIIIPIALLFFNFDFDPSTLCCSVGPVYNAITDKIKILSDNQGKSGVYCFTNLINGNQYIGSSVDLKRRFSIFLIKLKKKRAFGRKIILNN
jgi:hypothetical protein